MHINRLVLVGQVSSAVSVNDGYALFGLRVDAETFPIYVFDKVMIREAVERFAEGVTVQVDGRLNYDGDQDAGLYVAVTSDRPCDVRIVSDPARDGNVRPRLMTLEQSAEVRRRGVDTVAAEPEESPTPVPEPVAIVIAEAVETAPASTSRPFSRRPMTATAAPPSTPVPQDGDEPLMGSDAPGPARVNGNGSAPHATATSTAPPERAAPAPVAAARVPEEAPSPVTPLAQSAAASGQAPPGGRPVMGRAFGRPVTRVQSTTDAGIPSKPPTGGLGTLKSDARQDDGDVSSDDIPF